jgi:hypothetical protein
MKVLAINGSARKDGNTAILINTVFEELNKVDTKSLSKMGLTYIYPFVVSLVSTIWLTVENSRFIFHNVWSTYGVK